MAFEFKLPDIGEGVVEGEIVKWLVNVGDPIAVDQPMVEVMTDKATVVIPSPTQGIVKELRGAEGDIVEVHSVLVIIDDAGAAAPASAPSAPSPQPAQAQPAQAQPVAVAAPPQPTVPAGGLEHVSTTPTLPPPISIPPSNGGASAMPRTNERVLAAPATRRLARELSVDLQTVPGTGPAGRVTSDDVRRMAAAVMRAPVAPTLIPSEVKPATQVVRAPVALPTHTGDERIPVRGLRRRIWEKMAESAFTAAHFTFVEECDATDLVELRKRFNAKLKDGENKLTFLPFIIKAVVAALKAFPQVNGHVDDDNMEFIRRVDYHIGIAVASDRGLIVPVIRHADRRSFVELASEIVRLSMAVRDNKLTQDDIGGSTFTITSLGRDGGIFATPIINYPEVAILGVHKMKKQPVVIGDDIAIRSMMNLSLSFDHRLIDGHVGAAFAYHVIRLLEAPDRLMMEMA